MTCSDNSTYEADHVIVTVPLGVLKRDYTTMFTPELPVSKRNAIEGMSFGTMNKILLEFERPFWTNSEWSGKIRLKDSKSERNLTESFLCRFWHYLD